MLSQDVLYTLSFPILTLGYYLEERYRRKAEYPFLRTLVGLGVTYGTVGMLHFLSAQGVESGLERLLNQPMGDVTLQALTGVYGVFSLATLVSRYEQRVRTAGEE